jgi:hypothetical protein
VDAAAARARRKGDAVQAEAARGRAALVRSAARLAGLRRARPPAGPTAEPLDDAAHADARSGQAATAVAAATDGTAGRRQQQQQDEAAERYEIAAGLPIWDLRDLNGAPPQQLTASLGAVAQLLLRAAGYLAVRLPAEIVPPRAARGGGGSMHYAILPPASSYLGLAAQDKQDKPDGSSSSSRSRGGGAGSPSASGASTPAPAPRTWSRAVVPKYHSHQPPLPAAQSQKAARQQQQLPPVSQQLSRHHTARPRPLAVGKTLPRLRRDDPAAFSRFVEAASLLAWDAAWLATATATTPSSSSRKFERWTDACALGAALHAALLPSPLDGAGSGRLGVMSHGSAWAFLGGAPAEGDRADVRRVLREWRLASPTRLLDRVKSYLVADAAGAEWEQVGLPAGMAGDAEGAAGAGEGEGEEDEEEDGGGVLVPAGSEGEEDDGGRPVEGGGMVFVVRRPAGKR